MFKNISAKHKNKESLHELRNIFTTGRESKGKYTKIKIHYKNIRFEGVARLVTC